METFDLFELKSVIVHLDSSKTLRELVRETKFIVDEPTLQTAIDEVELSGVGSSGEKELFLVHFQKPVTYDEAKAALARNGLRSVGLRDLVQVGAEHREMMVDFPIVTLGVEIQYTKPYPLHPADAEPFVRYPTIVPVDITRHEDDVDREEEDWEKNPRSLILSPQKANSLFERYLVERV